MTSAAFDEILRRLVAAGAEFVVIGGLALGARGVVRATKDIDIVVSPDAENLKRVAEVAVEAGGHVQRGEALLGTPFSIAAELASGEQMAIETQLGRPAAAKISWTWRTSMRLKVPIAKNRDRGSVRWASRHGSPPALPNRLDPVVF